MRPWIAPLAVIALLTPLGAGVVPEQSGVTVLTFSGALIVQPKRDLTYPLKIEWKDTADVQIVPGDVVEVRVEGPFDRLLEVWTRPWEKKFEKPDGKDTIVTTEKFNPRDQIVGKLGESIQVSIKVPGQRASFKARAGNVKHEFPVVTHAGPLEVVGLAKTREPDPNPNVPGANPTARPSMISEDPTGELWYRVQVTIRRRAN